MSLYQFLLVSLLYGLSILKLGCCIDCFKCVSRNGNYHACEDPFHNNYTADILQSPCMGGRKQRDGLFLASSCIKINGNFLDINGEINGTIMIRGCALDSGTLTTDTEIVRMSHCGGFYYDGSFVKGCVQSCDTEACNGATSTPTTILTMLITLTLLYLVL